VLSLSPDRELHRANDLQSVVRIARHQGRGGPDGRAGRRLRDVSALAISPEQHPRRTREVRRADGSLYGELFDGIGFVRGAKRKGFDFTGVDCLIVGAGGVGSAIATAIAAEDTGSISLCDVDAMPAEQLAARLRRRFPGLAVGLRDNDPAGCRLVVNATPLGMAAGDPLPFDPMRLAGDTFVGDVVLTAGLTPLLKAVAQRGCRYQVGTDRHCRGPNLDATPNDIIRRIERYSGADAFAIPDLDREVKWHCKYARQNGIHVSPTFMIDGLVQADVSSGDPVADWVSRLLKD
jgi:hypothetical protein